MVGSRSTSESRRRILSLTALHTFDVAAKHQSFSKAAVDLGVTPSAVSHQIKKLEDDIGMTLFERRNRLVVLNDKGRELASPLNKVFGELYSLLDSVRETASSSLVVSVMSSFAAKWLAPRIARFSAANPDLQIRLVSADQLTDFRREDIDFGIRYGEGSYQDLYTELLMKVDVFPVCSREMLVGRPDLRSCGDLRHYQLLHDESCLKSPDLPNWRLWLDMVEAKTINPDIGPVFETPQLALEAALAGHGVALGMSPLVADDLRTGRLVRPFAEQLSGKFAFWLVCLPERVRVPKIRRFAGWLRDEAAAC